MAKAYVLKIFTVFTLTLLAFAPSLKAEEAHPWSDLELLLEEFTENENYSDFMGDIVKQKNSWTCKDRRYFWSVNWQSALDDVDIDFDPANPDITTIHVRLREGSVFAQYYKKGGVFCSWSGSGGRLRVDNIHATLTIEAQPNGDLPYFDVEKLKLDKLAIEDVDVLFASVFNAKFKKASPKFARWVEENLNGLIATFLKTELKERVMRAINKKVRERVREELDGQGKKDNSSQELP